MRIMRVPVLYGSKYAMNSMILRHVKKIAILILGGTVLLFGIVLIFLPGPSFIVIPAGLAILAVEFAWARTLLKKAQRITGHDIFKYSSWKQRFINGRGKRLKMND